MGWKQEGVAVLPVVVALVLLACVDLCGGATVVDVYRLIQYDVASVPFGSRFAALNHHAASLSSSDDLSRSVLLLPLRQLNLTLVAGIASLSPFFFC